MHVVVNSLFGKWSSSSLISYFILRRVCNIFLFLSRKIVLGGGGGGGGGTGYTCHKHTYQVLELCSEAQMASELAQP